MTVSTARYGNPMFDCSGARLRAQSRRLATVVTVSGEISAANIDRITDYASHFVPAATTIVLDLSGVTGMDEHGMALLRTLDRDCNEAGIDWVLVPSRSVSDVLCSDDVLYPLAVSVADALTYFADETLLRRSLLLPLLTKSA
jgi:anti-anti-sigma factor